ncbi:MAG: hypothetical protein ABSB40_11815 [Nitrososphaeria archaeon]|jgi:hypothetical protein
MNKKHGVLCLALFLMLPLMNFAMVQSLNGTSYPSKMNETTSLSAFSSYINSSYIDILSEQSSVSMPVNTSISNNTSLYSINVFSNINALINISPSAPNNVYRENTTVTLTAPSSVPLDGFLGALGAKYDFKDWSCSCGSTYTSNPLTFTIMSGDMQNLVFNANYVPDYTIVYVIVVTIVIVVIILALLLLKEAKLENKKGHKAETAKIMDKSENVKDFPAEEKKDDSVKEGK